MTTIEALLAAAVAILGVWLLWPLLILGALVIFGGLSIGVLYTWESWQAWREQRRSRAAFVRKFRPSPKEKP
jgi:hypothetical protein